MPVVFCFPHETAKNRSCVFELIALWRLEPEKGGRQSLPITLRGIRESSLVKAGELPSVPLRRADVVRVGAFRSYRAFGLPECDLRRPWRRDLYTAR